ncbi:lysophospholipid acyltransferase LPCAT4 [Acipenser oxyrinchus oxyrinchus]|uniref:Lysophospholipid acyltransferase LPCAT4 n=1 Tax=Acipenser oxyrinchus oxyrinchus TaxID=40147 RepID=A0AAD8FPB9_ACIOX|nr:lysophospholipid acyltransferase LPCAT4 [Acipenser oxyrinchus oxyrinchus]
METSKLSRLESKKGKDVIETVNGNPFVHELTLTNRQKVKVALLGTVLFPVRMLLTVLVFLILWPISRLRFLGLSKEQVSQPITGWRWWFLQALAWTLCRVLFFVMGFMKVKVRGRMAPPTEAPILVVAPHSSFLDSIVMVPCGLVTVMSRAENLNIPIVGDLLRFNQAIIVSRQDPESRRSCVEELKKRVSASGQWSQILIFPEGTTTNGTALIKFKAGAFIVGVPVQPVIIRYPNKLDTIRWTWKGINIVQVLWYTLSQFYTSAEIEFLPVYTPTQEEKDNPTLFASNVQKTMARVLGVHATEFEFEGRVPVTRVGLLKLPVQPVARVTETRLQKTGAGMQAVLNGMGRLVEKCCRLPAHRLTLEQCAELLNLPASQPDTHALLSPYCQGSDGLLELREFVLGMLAVDKTWSIERVLELAFTFFEMGSKGWLSKGEFSRLLQALLSCPELDVTQLIEETNLRDKYELPLEELQDLFKSKQNFKSLFTCYLRPEGEEPAKTTPFANGRGHTSNGVGLAGKATSNGTASSNKKCD